MRYTKIIESDEFTPNISTSLITEHGLGVVTSLDGTFIMFPDAEGIQKYILSTGVITCQKTWASLSMSSPTSNVFMIKNDKGIYCVHTEHGSYNIYLIRFNANGTYSSFVTSTTSPGIDGKYYCNIYIEDGATSPFLAYNISGSAGLVRTSDARVTIETAPENYSIWGYFVDYPDVPVLLCYNSSNELVTYTYYYTTDTFEQYLVLSSTNYISSLTSAESLIYKCYLKAINHAVFMFAPFLNDTTYQMRCLIRTIPWTFPIGNLYDAIYNVNEDVLILPHIQEIVNNTYPFGYCYNYVNKDKMYMLHRYNMMPYEIKTFSDSTTYDTICPCGFGLIRASSTDCVIEYETIEEMNVEAIVTDSMYSLRSAERLQNTVYRFYNYSNELISITKILRSSYSNGIYTHNCQDLRKINVNIKYNNVLDGYANLDYDQIAQFAYNIPGNWSWSNSLAGWSSFHSDEITQNQAIEKIEGDLNKYTIFYPDSCISSYERNSGITLSYSNKNFYAESLTESEDWLKPSRIIAYGKSLSIRVDKTSGSAGVILRKYFNNIDNISDLEDAVDALFNSYSIQVYTVQVKATELVHKGEYLTLNVSAKSTLHPILGAFNDTMYVTSSTYDLNEECSILTLQSEKTFTSSRSTSQELFEISDALSENFQKGNIYLPFFQATNYNIATSAWVSQSCADNTITALNIYNIVQNKGGFVWSSSNRTKIYVPTAGWYLFQARVQFEGNTSGTRQARLRIDGVNADTHMTSQFLTQGSGDTIVNATGMGYVNAGSYVECCGLQDTSPGVSLNMKYCAFNIVRLSL